MKKTTIFFACIVMSFSVVSFFGCRKFTVEHPVCPPAPAPKCLIDYMTYQDPGYPGVDTIKFTYNADGNPISGFRTHLRNLDDVFEENYYWRYDASGKLTELYELFNYDTTNLSFVANWHRFTYDSNSNIVFDSLYVLPNLSTGHMTSYEARGSIVYTYDAQHRMTHALGTEGSYVIEDQTFQYLSNNMFGKPYDDSVSLYSTSKIWQFMGRDYSVSNPIDWLNFQSYNGHELPALFQNIYSQNWRFFKSSAGDGLIYREGEYGRIHYTCDAPAAPAGKAY